MKKTALYLSHLLNPAMLALVIFGLQGLLDHWLVGGMGICAFALMPGLVLLILVRWGYLDQVYPEDRHERGILLLLGILCYTLGWVGLYWLGATLLVLVSAATFVVSTLLVWWINRYWKISIHATGVGGAACILLVSFANNCHQRSLAFMKSDLFGGFCEKSPKEFSFIPHHIQNICEK